MGERGDGVEKRRGRGRGGTVRKKENRKKREKKRGHN